MVSKNNIADLRERFNTLAKKARLEDKQIEADELRLRQQDPEFWDDADNAAKQSQKLKSLEKFLEGIRRVADAVEECELYSE
jgi:peptide chain release factor 2